jgi:hypothetical protein
MWSTTKVSAGYEPPRLAGSPSAIRRGTTAAIWSAIVGSGSELASGQPVGLPELRECSEATG